MERTRHEEISSGLPILRFVTHIDEILTRFLSRAKVRHPALCNDAYFVEEVVKLLPCLVNRHNGGKTSYIRADT
jgi:hypothetical protein